MVAKLSASPGTSPRGKRKDLAIDKQNSSLANTEVSRKKTTDAANLTYSDLNSQLMFPKNPVYSLVKKGSTSDTIQA
jgi:hypothetical protein